VGEEERTQKSRGKVRISAARRGSVAALEDLLCGLEVKVPEDQEGLLDGGQGGRKSRIFCVGEDPRGEEDVVGCEGRRGSAVVLIHNRKLRSNPSFFKN
jgi:hypothetical protein